MKIHYVFAHPNKNSYHRALFDAAQSVLAKTDSVTDLYAINFKAVADWEDFKNEEAKQVTAYNEAQQLAFSADALSHDIQSELSALDASNFLIIQFPLWWFSAPAIVKGWFDRVLVKGKAYSADKKFNTGGFKGKKAMLVTSTQSPSSSFKKDGLNGPIEQTLFSMHHALRFVGFDIVEPYVAYGVLNQTNEERQELIKNYRDTIKNLDKRAIINFSEREL